MMYVCPCTSPYVTARHVTSRHCWRQECTLILTEGDSAKTLAVSGLGVVGRDRYGVFPLKGKLLNVREATNPQVLKNEEIQVRPRQHLDVCSVPCEGATSDGFGALTVQYLQGKLTLSVAQRSRHRPKDW